MRGHTDLGSHTDFGGLTQVYCPSPTSGGGGRGGFWGSHLTPAPPPPPVPPPCAPPASGAPDIMRNRTMGMMYIHCGEIGGGVTPISTPHGKWGGGSHQNHPQHRKWGEPTLKSTLPSMGNWKGHPKITPSTGNGVGGHPKTHPGPHPMTYSGGTPKSTHPQTGGIIQNPIPRRCWESLGGSEDLRRGTLVVQGGSGEDLGVLGWCRGN